MKTKYILHGGNAQDVNEENRIFFSEVLSDCPAELNVLLVQFAAVEEKQKIYKDRHIFQFERVKSNKIIHYQIASIINFIEQIKWADVIYISGAGGGGATTRLLNILRKFKNIKGMFKGKIIAGESAGANCLSSYFYSKSSGILQGLSCVPVKIICHYQSGEEEKFKNIPDKIEELFLPNYQFRVFKI